MRDKIVRAVFGSSMATRTEAVWQHDYGLVMELAGLELPESYEVYFGTAFRGADALRMIGGADGVDIPDELLELGKTIYAWLFLHTGEDDGETVAMVTIPVNMRPKGSDVEPTPVQQDVITQAIAALNSAVDEAEGIRDAIPETVNTALIEAKESGEFDGPPGPSPTVTITEITGGHRITITDATGSHSADVMDGVGNVRDVQVNGVSVLTDGVANVPIGSTTTPGVLGIAGTNYGIGLIGGQLIYVAGASSTDVKAGNQGYKPIGPQRQHESTFYGLAKAAGDTTQSASSNAVGQYTESAKSAISEMLSGSVSVSGITPTINALPGVRYVCGEVSTLDIVTPETGIVDVVFASGATPTVLTVTPPSGMTMRWAGGFDPTSLEADTVYEVNIADGVYGVVGQWN